MPSFTIWSRGRHLGETTFELQPTGPKRAGIFHPTAIGIEVLPAITAMMPALFDFGALCEQAGFDTDDDDPRQAHEALERFENTPVGRRLASAAREIADLELRDPGGKPVLWNSILISDVDDIMRVAQALERDADHGDDARAESAPSLHQPQAPLIRYMISVTLAPGGTALPVS